MSKKQKPPPPQISIDYALYAEFLADTNLSDAQKEALITELWGLICEFVALGFHVHPTQKALENCGQAFRQVNGSEKPVPKSHIIEEEGPTYV